MNQGLQGLRILIVEDEYLVATEIEDMMLELGAEVAGPYGRLQPARAAAEKERVDGAILDIKLDGDEIYALIDELRAKSVPIILTTGFDREGVAPDYRDIPRLRKPFNAGMLGRLAAATFGKRPEKSAG